MAIIIPPSHIYNVEENEFENNRIDQIDISIKKISPRNEVDTGVYEADVTQISSNSYESEAGQNIVGRRVYSHADRVTADFYFGAVFLQAETVYKEGTVQISKIEGKKFVSKISSGMENGKIKSFEYSVFGHTVTRDIASDIFGYYSEDNVFQGVGTIYGIAEAPREKVSETGPLDLPLLPFSVVMTEPEIVDKTITSTLSNNSEISITEDDENYTLYYRLYCGATKMEMRGEKSHLNVPIATNFTQDTINVSGQKIQFVPEKIEIKVFGNTMGIDVSEGSLTIGSGQNVSKFGGNNELMQDSAGRIVSTSSPPYTELANALTNGYSKTIDLYKSGKKSLVLLCQIGNYYDEEGNLVISDSRIPVHDVSVSTSFNPPFNSIFFSMAEPKEFDVVIIYTYESGSAEYKGEARIERGKVNIEVGVPLMPQNVKFYAHGAKMTFSIYDVVIPQRSTPKERDEYLETAIVFNRIEVVGVSGDEKQVTFYLEQALSYDVRVNFVLSEDNHGNKQEHELIIPSGQTSGYISVYEYYHIPQVIEYRTYKKQTEYYMATSPFYEDENGNAAKYRCYGIENSYRGVAWQKLYLQEE